MSIFSKAESNYYEEIKVNLKPRDKRTHVVLAHTCIDNANKPEIAYNTKINNIMEKMQQDGYEIIDVKLVIGGHGLFYETLITYK